MKDKLRLMLRKLFEGTGGVFVEHSYWSDDYVYWLEEQVIKLRKENKQLKTAIKKEFESVRQLLDAKK